MPDIPTPSDTDRSEVLRSQIDAAIKAGGNLNEIIDHLSSSEDPFHQSYARRLKGEEVQNDEPAMRPIPKQDEQTQTPLINASQNATTGFLDLPLGEQIGYGAAGLGTLGATGLAMYAGKEAIRNKISKAMNPESPEFKRQNDLSERRLALAEAEAARTEALNPIQQAKIEAIKADNARKQEAHDQKLALEREAHLAKLNKNIVEVAGGKNITPEITPAEPTPGLTKLETATGGPLSSVRDINLAQEFVRQQEAKANAPATPPTTAPAPVTPPATAPANPVTVAQAATPPSVAQGGAPTAPGGEGTTDLQSIKLAASDAGEKAASPDLVANVQAKTELQNKQVQDAILNQNRAAPPATPPATPPVEIPEGRIPNYMTGKKDKNGKIIEYNNKQGKDVIGKGGWNWYQGQMGPEAETNWLHQFGRTNQTYRDVTQAVKEGRLVGAQVNEKGQGGKFPREPHVPNYIKGSTNLQMLGGLAGAGIGGLAAYEAYKHGQETGDYSNLGQLGMDLALMPKGAGAIPYMLATHTGELNANEKEELAKRRKMPMTISKSVPPPSK